MSLPHMFPYVAVGTFGSELLSAAQTSSSGFASAFAEAPSEAKSLANELTRREFCFSRAGLRS